MQTKNSRGNAQQCQDDQYSFQFHIYVAQTKKKIIIGIITNRVLGIDLLFKYLINPNKVALICINHKHR